MTNSKNKRRWQIILALCLLLNAFFFGTSAVIVGVWGEGPFLQDHLTIQNSWLSIILLFLTIYLGAAAIGIINEKAWGLKITGWYLYTLTLSYILWTCLNLFKRETGNYWANLIIILAGAVASLALSRLQQKQQQKPRKIA